MKIIIPLLILCQVSLAAETSSQTPENLPAGFDEELKIWFPPDASEEVYVRRDPSHSFANDVRKAFESDHALRERVCARLTSPDFTPGTGVLPPNVAQLRTIENMLCLSVGMHERMLADQAKKSEQASDLLAGWYAEDRAEALRMTPEERRQAEYELRYSAYQLPSGNERARAGVKMIALRPSDDMAIAFLLEHGGEARYGSPQPGDIERMAALPGETPHFFASKDSVRRFVTNLYQSMIATEGNAAGPFRSGWAGYLHLSGGDLGEARRLAASYVSDPANDNVPFETVFVAYLDRLLGKPQPLAGLLSNCPFEPQDAFAASISGNYCRVVAWSLAQRLIEARGRDAARAAGEIIREAIRAEPANWTMRLQSTRTLDRIAPEEAAREYRAMLDLPATVMPQGVRLDVIDGVALGFMDRQDYPGALAVNLRWLDTFGYKPVPFPTDGWSRLASLQKAADSGAPCDDALACVLNKRISLALQLRDVRLARRTIQERLAYAFRAGFPEESRLRLEDLAREEIDLGHRDAALRIVRYLWPQPKDPVLAQLLKEHRVTLSPAGGPLVEMTPESSPW